MAYHDKSYAPSSLRSVLRLLVPAAGHPLPSTAGVPGGFIGSARSLSNYPSPPFRPYLSVRPGTGSRAPHDSGARSTSAPHGWEERNNATANPCSVSGRPFLRGSFVQLCTRARASGWPRTHRSWAHEPSSGHSQALPAAWLAWCMGQNPSSGAEHAKLRRRTRHGTRQSARAREGRSWQNEANNLNPKSCGWFPIYDFSSEQFVEFLPHKGDPEEERTRTIMCSGAKAKLFLSSCMHALHCTQEKGGRRYGSFSHRPERITRSSSKAGPVQSQSKLKKRTRAVVWWIWLCETRPIRAIMRSIAAVLPSGPTVCPMEMDHTAPSCSCRLPVHPSERNGTRKPVHGTRTIPSIHLSPGRIMNRWVPWRALLRHRHRLGFRSMRDHGLAAPPGPRRIGAS